MTDSSATVQLSLDQLAARTGETTERLERWQALGFMGSADGDNFSLDDVGRVQMVQLALRNGFDAKALERSVDKLRAPFDRFMQWLRPPERVYSVAEAAKQLGLEPGELRPFWDAAGLGDEFEEVSDQDVAVLSGLR